jgi:hypothetical protein
VRRSAGCRQQREKHPHHGAESTTITTAETLVVNAVPDTSCSIVRPGKRLINPSTLAQRYFTIEEYEGDIDQPRLAQDFVLGPSNSRWRPTAC